MHEVTRALIRAAIVPSIRRRPRSQLHPVSRSKSGEGCYLKSQVEHSPSRGCCACFPWQQTPFISPPISSLKSFTPRRAVRAAGVVFELWSRQGLPKSFQDMAEGHTEDQGDRVMTALSRNLIVCLTGTVMALKHFPGLEKHFVLLDLAYQAHSFGIFPMVC